MNVAQRYASRGYDAVQLAVSLHLQQDAQFQHLSITVVSADDELNAAAAAEGLAVDNPNDHP